LPEAPIKLFGANILPMEILVVVGAVLMMLAVEFSTAKPSRQSGGRHLQ
jgi:branched-chain amino acid transport system permease protein